MKKKGTHMEFFKNTFIIVALFITSSIPAAQPAPRRTVRTRSTVKRTATHTRPATRETISPAPTPFIDNAPQNRQRTTKKSLSYATALDNIKRTMQSNQVFSDNVFTDNFIKFVGDNASNSDLARALFEAGCYLHAKFTGQDEDDDAILMDIQAQIDSQVDIWQATKPLTESQVKKTVLQQITTKEESLAQKQQKLQGLKNLNNEFEQIINQPLPWDKTVKQWIENHRSELLPEQQQLLKSLEEKQKKVGTRSVRS